MSKRERNTGAKGQSSAYHQGSLHRVKKHGGQVFFSLLLIAGVNSLRSAGSRRAQTKHQKLWQYVCLCVPEEHEARSPQLCGYLVLWDHKGGQFAKATLAQRQDKQCRNAVWTRPREMAWDDWVHPADMQHTHNTNFPSFRGNWNNKRVFDRHVWFIPGHYLQRETFTEAQCKKINTRGRLLH